MRMSDWSSDVCCSDLAAALETRLHHLGRQPGAADGVDPGVAHLAFADVAVEVADRHLVARRARKRTRAGRAHAVGAGLLQGDTGHVATAVRRNVARWLVNLIQQLPGAGGTVDTLARTRPLRVPKGAAGATHRQRIPELD